MVGHKRITAEGRRAGRERVPSLNWTEIPHRKHPFNGRQSLLGLRRKVFPSLVPPSSTALPAIIINDLTMHFVNDKFRLVVDFWEQFVNSPSAFGTFWHGRGHGLVHCGHPLISVGYRQRNHLLGLNRTFCEVSLALHEWSFTNNFQSPRFSLFLLSVCGSRTRVNSWVIDSSALCSYRIVRSISHEIV